MPSFRRLLDGTAILRRPDDGTGAADPAVAGGTAAAAAAATDASSSGQSTSPLPTQTDQTAAGGSTPTESPAVTEGAPGGTPVTPAAAPVNRTASRIDALTREKWDAIRAREAAEAELEVLRARLAGAADPTVVAAQPGASTLAPVVPGSPEFQRAVQAQAAADRFREAADRLVADGRTAHADFDAAIGSFTSRFGPVPQFLVEAALEAPNPADAIYALARDPAEADRIMSLGSPTRMTAAFLRMATDKPAAQRETASRAPAPIKPAVGTVAAKQYKLDDDDIPMEEFVRLRTAQLAAKRANGATR